MSQRCQYRNSLAIGMTHVDRQRSLRADALEHTETRDVHERHYACQLEAGVLEERPLRWARSPWSLGERASRLVRGNGPVIVPAAHSSWRPEPPSRRCP
jgi:hypothetical protein